MSEAMSTKEKILEAALTIFSEKGYDAASVDELAELAGVKGPAIYYHFKGKDAILDGIVEKVENHYEKHFGSPHNIEPFPNSLEELISISMKRIDFTIHDEKIKKIRRLIITEQFRNERMRNLATKHFVTGIENLYVATFEHMIREGILVPDDAKILASEFTAPITQLVHLIDREPEKEQQAMEKVKAHLEHFVKIYGRRN